MWVIVRFNDGRWSAWRTHEGHTWGSPIYDVMGYFIGTWNECRSHIREFKLEKEQC